MPFSVDEVLNNLDFREVPYALRTIRLTLTDSQDVSTLIDTVGIVAEWGDQMPGSGCVGFASSGGHNLLIADHLTGVIWGFSMKKCKQHFKIIRKAKLLAVIAEDVEGQVDDADFNCVRLVSFKKMIQGIALRN